MKERILYGWSIRRALYLVIGGAVIAESVIQRQWIGVALGSYFFLMGLFNFGCASGSCSYEPGRKENRRSLH